MCHMRGLGQLTDVLRIRFGRFLGFFAKKV